MKTFQGDQKKIWGSLLRISEQVCNRKHSEWALSLSKENCFAGSPILHDSSELLRPWARSRRLQKLHRGWLLQNQRALSDQYDVYRKILTLEIESIGESLNNLVVKSLGSPIKHKHLVADKKQIQFSELTVVSFLLMKNMYLRSHTLKLTQSIFRTGLISFLVFEVKGLCCSCSSVK